MRCEDCNRTNAEYRCLECGAYLCENCKDIGYGHHECYFNMNIVTIKEYNKIKKDEKKAQKIS